MTTIWEWPKEWRGTAESTFRLLPANLQSLSPYTGSASVYGPQVQRFKAELTFPRMKAPQHRRVQAFITRLQGVNGFIRMVDYHRMKPAHDQFRVDPTQENWSDGTTFDDGTGWVSGYLPPFVVADEVADEGADSLVVRMLPASLKAALGMGDLFEVRPGGIHAEHGHLYEVVRDANVSATGKARLYFEPGLRRRVAAGDMIVLSYPTSVFRLSADDEGAVSRGLGSRGQMGFSLDEVLPWQ